MNATRVLLARQPLIRFLGKRSVPKREYALPRCTCSRLTHVLQRSITPLKLTLPRRPANSPIASLHTEKRLSNTVLSTNSRLQSRRSSVVTLGATLASHWDPSSPQQANTLTATIFLHASGELLGAKPKSKPSSLVVRAYLHEPQTPQRSLSFSATSGCQSATFYLYMGKASVGSVFPFTYSSAIFQLLVDIYHSIDMGHDSSLCICLATPR